MNILFTTLSTMHKTATSFFITGKDNIYNSWCTGIQQQEPGAKKFLSEEDIDKIVIFGSRETFNNDFDNELFNTNLKNWAGVIDTLSFDEMKQLSTLRFFVYRLAEFVYGDSAKTDQLFLSQNNPDAYTHYQEITQIVPYINLKTKEISVVFIPDHNIDGTDNLKTLIKNLQGTADAPSRLFMDMQGGARTAIYVNNALLQLLSNQEHVYHAELKRVVATSFNPKATTFPDDDNKITDETNLYRILDLVSGMNAFLKYGKSDLLKEYIEELKQESGFVVDKNVDELINRICDIDNAISFCRIKESADEENKETKSGTMYLMDAIRGLKAIIETIETNLNKNKANYVGTYFDILIDGIKADFGKLLTKDEIDVIALIDWCIKKNNYVTATAIAEDSLPAYFVKYGILYYAQDKDELEQAENYFQFKRVTTKQKNMFANINHYYIKNYLSIIKVYPWYGEKDFDENYNKTYSLNETLKNCSRENKNFPVSLYSNTKRVSATRIHDGVIYSVYEPLANQILSLYSFVSYNRNCLAHASNESGVKPETLKKRFDELMDLIRDYRHRDEVPFYLTDSTIRDKEDEILANRENIINREISYEIQNNDYGMASYFITKRTKPNKKNPIEKGSYADVYATFPLLISLVGLSRNWAYLKKNDFTKNSLNKIISFIAEKCNQHFIELMIKYCNEKGISVPQYENIKKKTDDYISSEVSVEDDDVLRILKKRITNLNDLYNMTQSYATLEDWQQYCVDEKKIIQAEWKAKGADDIKSENRAQLTALFSSLGKDSVPKWKKVISFFLDKNNPKYNDNLHFLLGKLRLDRL